MTMSLWMGAPPVVSSCTLLPTGPLMEGSPVQHVQSGSSPRGSAQSTDLVSGVSVKAVCPKSIARSERRQHEPFGAAERLRASPRSQPKARKARLRWLGLGLGLGPSP